MTQQPTTKTELISLSQVKTNAENPRAITSEKFQKLVNSILVFPKMLELRPIVINSQFVALGGNMRTNALNYIAKLSMGDINARLTQIRDYVRLSTGEKELLAKYWEAWLKKPVAHTVKADTLSETEQEQFIIKDNVSFGAWDWDALANKFDNKDLGDWGMDVWQDPADFAQPTGTSVTPTVGGGGVVPSYPADSEDDGVISPDNFGVECTLPEGEKSPFQQMTFTLANAEAELIKSAIDTVKQSEDIKNVETFGNQNSNGNAIYLIVKQWAEQRK